MSRYNGLAAMDIRQHVGTSRSPHPLQQFGSQVTGNNENLLSPLSNPSPSASIDLSTLNPSYSSNITSDFASSFFDSSSQNSLGRNVGSATLIPLSQSQNVPAKGTVNGGVVPADEWSGTTTGTPSTQQHQGLQSPQGQGPSAQAALLSKQQFVYEGRLPSSSQVLQGFGNNQYQAGLSASQQSGGSQGGSRDGLRAFPSGAAQGGTSGVSQQVTMQSQQGDVQPMDISVVKTEYPSFKTVKSEFTAMEGVKTEYGSQESLTHAELVRSSQDSAYQEGSFHAATTSNQNSGLEGGPTGSQQSGLEGDTKVHILMPPQNQVVGMTRSGSFQGGVISGPGSTSGNGPVQTANLQQPSHERNQQGMNRVHSNFQGMPQPGQQSLRSLGLMQGGNSQGGLQSPGAIAQQAGLAGQANANQFAHSQRSASQQSLMQMQMMSANQLSSYQAQVQAQAQAQAQAMSQVHAQAQAANQQASLQQAVANQAVMMQARQAQQAGTGHQQQLLFHSGQQHQMQSGQAQAFQLTAAQQQILARMQPGMQNQLLQGLKLGGRQLIQGPGTGVGSLTGGNPDIGFRTPMPPAIASECSHLIMLYIQEQRKRPPDNNITFWMNLVRDFFEPGALKRWCLSSYNTSPVGRHAQGLFPMEFWFCNLCGVQPGRGFESCTDVLPRLFKIKYDSGLLDELLFLDLAEERYVLPSGKMVLEYSRAVHESIFADLRVVRYGMLRVTFSSSLKIQAWEFCTKSHEEVVPCKNLLEQAEQLASLVMEAEQEDFDKSVENLTKHCNAFTSTARQLAVKLDAPMVNDLGFSKRYVRCLQISEVVNSMKDLVSFEKKTGLGPIHSLAMFPSARKLQQEGLLTNLPSQPSLTQLINHLTQSSPHQSTPYVQHQGQIMRHPNGQQGAPQIQGHIFSQFQPGSLSQANREPSMGKISHLSSHLQSQLRSQMDARNFGLVQAGQAYSNQMQPPGSFHVTGNSQVHPGSSTPSSGLSAQLQSRMNAQGLPQLHSQSSTQVHPGIGSGNQVQLQLNHAQALSQLQGQATESPALSGGHASPNLNHLSQQTFQSLSKQLPPQPSGHIHSQSHLLNQPMANGVQHSLPGTPQSEVSDLRSNA